MSPWPLLACPHSNSTAQNAAQKRNRAVTAGMKYRMSSLLALAERIEQTSLGTAIAESSLAFPIIEGIHLIGLSVAVGLLFFTDLRLMGVLFKKIPLTDVLHQLRPWMLGGFIAIFISGGLLFLAEATVLVSSPAFAFKLVFLALAGINALYFEFVIARRPEVKENRAVLPSSVRYAGFASLTLWTLVIISGRLIPYLPAWS